MEELNPIIHQPTRLKIMSALASLDKEVKVDFNYLLDLLSLSEGNLSIHLKVLNKEGFISILKEFVNQRPKTWIWITEKGRDALQEYIILLEKIIKGENLKKE